MSGFLMAGLIAVSATVIGLLHWLDARLRRSIASEAIVAANTQRPFIPQQRNRGAS